MSKDDGIDEVYKTRVSLIISKKEKKTKKNYLSLKLSAGDRKSKTQTVIMQL